MIIKFCDKTRLQIEDTRLLDEYASKLIQWNGLSLIAKSTEADIYGWHILDALSIMPLVNGNKGAIVDFGAGGGVLGISLACVGVNNIILVERSQSKVGFLRDILKFPNVASDCANISGPILLLARGVSTITNTLKAACGADVDVKSAIFLKSFNVEKEIKEAKECWNFEYKVYPRVARAHGKVVYMSGIERV